MASSGDNVLEQFAMITGASPHEAHSWLEMAGFVLQDAVDLYFSSAGAEESGARESASGQSGSARASKHSLDEEALSYADMAYMDDDERDSEFTSHTLNRDFWADECVKDMVLCSFVFWQQ
ncbi:hypothetical protein B484DRAFT_440129, partial [Ochromonadaceae sp. CCMP2298]